MTNRNCGNCRHFQMIKGAPAGHCTNPLVVSHLGGLVMYREAEIGCRRGWKQDLWESSDDLAETPDVHDERIAARADRDRADFWANQTPSEPEELDSFEAMGDRPILSDDDLLNPRGTRNVREAMRRAREVRKRELSASSRRDPSSQPTFTAEGVAGEDSVIDERPVPFERPRLPIVPPVSLEEVRKHVDDARRTGRDFETPINVSFREDDDRFSELLDPNGAMGNEAAPLSPVPYASLAEAGVPEAPYAAASEYAEADRWDDGDLYESDEPYEAPVAASEAYSASVSIDYRDELQPTEPGGWGETIWSREAPWAGDDVLLDPLPEPKPRRRGIFGSLLHRREAAQSGHLSREDEMSSWENSREAWPAAESWQSEQPGVYAEPAYAEELREDIVAPRTGDSAQLPPFPYDTDEESGEDYLLADSTFGEREEDEVDTARLPRICETCRYLKPSPTGPTCGAVYAQTYQRRIDLQRLSCASSIGAWWLPSDEYWESRVDISHHGDPTPLLEQYAIRLEERGNDDDLHTT
ncbi:hypothetical protein BH09CHL1_BH09CHL1_34160 [soil metagenome]